MMKLTLDTLKNSGAFTGRPVEKEITWKDKDGVEHTATTYVRPLGFHSAKFDLLAMNGKSDGVACRIASSICDEYGNPVLTPDDVTGHADPERGALDGNMTIALLVAIHEVNNMGKESSAQKTNSGVN